MPPEELPCVARLAALETAMHEVQTDLRRMRATQKKALQVARIANDDQMKQLLQQSDSILAVTNTVLHLRNEVSKYAAGGSLAGAVLLFIAVRALGF